MEEFHPHQESHKPDIEIWDQPRHLLSDKSNKRHEHSSCDEVSKAVDYKLHILC